MDKAPPTVPGIPKRNSPSLKFFDFKNLERSGK